MITLTASSKKTAAWFIVCPIPSSCRSSGKSERHIKQAKAEFSFLAKCFLVFAPQNFFYFITTQNWRFFLRVEKYQKTDIDDVTQRGKTKKQSQTKHDVQFQKFLPGSLSRRVYVQSLCYKHQFSMILKFELITKTIISRFDSLWQRDWWKQENGLLNTDNRCDCQLKSEQRDRFCL